MTDPQADKEYSTPADGRKKIAAGYQYWTAKVGDISFQASLALIAANWTVFDKNLIKNIPAVASVGMALLNILVGLVAAKEIANLYYEIYQDAEKNRGDWTRAWEQSDKCESSKWPFTDEIEECGRLLLSVRVCLPVMSGILFVIAFFCGRD